MGLFDGTLSLPDIQAPQVPITNYVPSFLAQAGGAGAARREPIIVNQPRAAAALQNKYAPGSYMDELTQQYDPAVVAALRRYDADRVSRGQAPLSEQETRNSLQSAQTRTQTTPERKRSIWNLPGNAISDIGTILKSIPQIPFALMNEARSLPDIPQAISQGKNPIAGLANAPGIRMLPGAYIVGNLAGGTPGELARHPVFTALDVLPAAEGVAKTTKVVKAAGEISEAAAKGTAALSDVERIAADRITNRPIKGALLNTLDENGQIVRNEAGQLIDKLAETRPGRMVRQNFSQANRDVMYMVNAAAQRVRGIMGGQMPALDNLDRLANESFKFRDKLAELDPTLLDRLPELTERWSKGDFADMTPVELQAHEMARDLTARVGDWMAENYRAVKFNDELYDFNTGLKLKGLERNLQRAQALQELRGTVMSGQADVPSLLTKMQEVWNTPRRQAHTPGMPLPPRTGADQIADLRKMSDREVLTHHRATIQALRNAGYDTANLDEAFVMSTGGRKATKFKKAVPYDPEAYNRALTQIITDPTALPRKFADRNLMSAEEIVNYIKDNRSKATTGDNVQTAATTAALDLITTGISKNEWKTVTAGLDKLRKTKTAAFQDPVFVESVRQLRDSSRILDRELATFTEDNIATRTKRLEKLKAESVPARFMPKVDETTRSTLKERLIEANDPAQAAEIIKLADRGMWDQIPGFDDAFFNKVQRETARSWQAMRDEGMDPLFVHTVPPNKARQAINPMDSIVPREPTSIKRRVLNMAPGIKDVSVALTHQTMEFLSQRHIETAIKQIMDSVGQSEKQLRMRFAETAERRAAEYPALSYEGHLQQIMNEHYRKFDPDVEGYNWGSPYLNKLKQDQVWIPSGTAKNLKMLADPKTILGGVFDPVTGLFRAAVTSLSIRTQIYNMLGGAVAMELMSPGATLRYGKRAMDWMKNPDMVPQSLKEVVGQQKQTLLDMDKEALGMVHEGVYSYMKGKMLGKFWNDAQAAKVPGRGISRYGKNIKGLVEKAYDINGVVDDFYRTVAYIDEYDRAIKRGHSVEAAERAAISQTRKVLQDWMGMTPMERSVMKSIFPFYGFIGHAVRFVLRYPLDHPLRTEVISKLAMTEMEDQSALPSRFLSMLFFGGSGPEGDRNAINAAPFNPFGDVANYMTIQGMLGATNPVISTAFQMVGLTDGEAELYPSLRYDPETGRLTAQHANPLLALAENTVPQSGLLLSMLGINENYNDMLRRDPAAASRYLASTMTIPIVWRRVKVNEEIFKAEQARMTAAEKVKNEALKSGDWSEALMYPSLAAYLQQLDAMPEDQLAPYRPISRDNINAIMSGQQTGIQYQGTSPLDTLMQTPRPAPLPGSSLTVTTGGI